MLEIHGVRGPAPDPAGRSYTDPFAGQDGVNAAYCM